MLRVPIPVHDPFRLVRRDLFATIIHELIHALGFTDGTTIYWQNANNNGVNYSTESTSQIQARSITETGGKMYLTTPEVTALARQFFGCTTLPGAPLETGGGTRSRGSHWSTEYFEREVRRWTRGDMGGRKGGGAGG